jgi:hypothetical protein
MGFLGDGRAAQRARKAKKEMGHMSETGLQRQVQVELSDRYTRVFRNNVGFAWQGSNFRIENRRLVEGSARAVRYGLAVGSSDLIVPHSVLVTERMVGMRLLVFGAIETKDATRPSQQQRTFLKVIEELGGLSGCAHNVEQARAIITRLDNLK